MAFNFVELAQIPEFQPSSVQKMLELQSLHHIVYDCVNAGLKQSLVVVKFNGDRRAVIAMGDVGHGKLGIGNVAEFFDKFEVSATS